MGTPAPSFTTLTVRLLIGSVKRYGTCALSTLPVLLGLAVPLQAALVVLSRGVPSPADRLPAALFALQLTILSLVTSYALLPWATAALRGRLVPSPELFLVPGRRAIIAALLLVIGVSLRLRPDRYAVPALAFAALFLAVWPWVKSQASRGYRLVKIGMLRWRRCSLSFKLTAVAAFVLAQAAPLALGKAVVAAASALGGPPAGWASQIILAAGLIPLHLLIFVALGAKLSVQARRP